MVDTPKKQCILEPGGVSMARKYDREFKLEAVRLALEEGATASEVERRLGIGQGMISRWKREVSQQGKEAFPGKGHLPGLEEELRQAKRELGRVTRERDILKKAVAIFSEER
jgi:transposase